jgi:acetyl-CoA synthetase
MSADVLVADTRPIRYEKFMDGFKAEQIAAKLSGDFDAGLNACIECCDRHAQPGRVALFWEGSDGVKPTPSSS